MQEKKKDWIRLTVMATAMLAAVLIFSFTIGKDIYEGRDHSILSFGIIHFCGYLFFLLMPVEVAFIYCLNGNSETIAIIALALATAVSAQIIDYYIGYFVSSKLINRLFGTKKSDKAMKHINKYGNLTILIFNLFPLSSPVISLTAGMIKYPFKKVILFSIIGLLVKYSIIAWIVIAY